MACLSPLQIVNPTKVLSLDGGAPYLISVPCGHCAACRKTKHEEYYFRAYYQGLSTLNKGGFIHMHDLTYNNKSLPHISDYFDSVPRYSSIDFSCFCREDIRKFLLSVREILYRKGYDVKDNLNYFITSEYGDDKIVNGHKHTQRPHYHVLWYVTFDINPLVFSRLVGSCWKHGLTDTARHKSKAYVQKYIFFPGSDKMALSRSCNYVSKYVLKSSEFDKLINGRLYKLFEIETGLSGSALVDYIRTDGRELYRSYYRRVGLFHRQGNGFGSDFTVCNDMNEVLRTGMISIPDNKKVLKHIPMPMYFKRRLFYNQIKDFRGVRTWKLNDLGRDWFLNRALESTKLLANTFRDWFSNLSCYVRPLSKGEDFSSRDAHLVYLRNRVVELLGERSWLDFATYIGIYKGRVNSDDGLNRVFLDSPSVDPFDTWLCGYLPDVDNAEHTTFSYTTRQDADSLGERLVCDYWLGSVVTGYSPDARKLISKGPSMSLQDFINLYIVNDKSDPRFKGFDELYSIYLETCAQHEEQLTYADNHLQHVKQFYKTIFK